MSDQSEEASTEEELNALIRSGGFVLVQSSLVKDFRAFLEEYGEVGDPLCTQLPDGSILPYALLKPKGGVDSKQLRERIEAFLSKRGQVSFCTCQVVSDGIIVITAFVLQAKDRADRLKIVRSRRNGRPKSKE